MTDRPVAGIEEDARAEAFRRLAADHLDESYRLARAIVGDPTEAGDVVQAAFVKAWHTWDSLRDADRFDAWLGRIVVNSCRDRLRHRRRDKSQDLSSELIRFGGNPYRWTSEREVIRAALARLSPDQRVVVALRYWLGLSPRQIAERLGIREGRVHSYLNASLDHLREVLDELDESGGPHA